MKPAAGLSETARMQRRHIREVAGRPARQASEQQSRTGLPLGVGALSEVELLGDRQDGASRLHRQQLLTQLLGPTDAHDVVAASPGLTGRTTNPAELAGGHAEGRSGQPDPIGGLRAS